VITQKQVDARTIDLGIDSPAVGVKLPVRVLLPTGWSPTSTQRWPVAMLLHGAHDDYARWSTQTSVRALSADWPVIVVMPEGGQTAAYTNYLEKVTPARQWETFHTKELPQILQRGLRANTTRAIAGVSAGGYGAISYAARHPGLFRFAGSISGSLAIRDLSLQSGILLNDVWEGGMFIRYGLPDNPSWRQHDPFELADRLAGTSLWVSSGFTTISSPQDALTITGPQVLENGISDISHRFVDLLGSKGIPVSTHWTPLAAHDWPFWQEDLARAWPQMMAALGATRP